MSSERLAQKFDKFLPGFGPKTNKSALARPETPIFRPPQSSEPKAEQKAYPKSREGQRLKELFDGQTLTVNFGNREKWGEAHHNMPRNIGGIYDLTDDEAGPAIIEILSDKDHYYFTDAVDGQQTLFRLESPVSAESISEIKLIAQS